MAKAKVREDRYPGQDSRRVTVARFKRWCELAEKHLKDVGHVPLHLGPCRSKATSTVRKLCLLRMLASASALVVQAQDVTFVQLTDAHIFDAGNKDQPALERLQDKLDNRSSLAWAIEQTDQLVSSGKSIDVLIFTGDWGLEETDPNSAARDVALFFRALLVKKILLVPGNNDLTNEDPKELPSFQRFADQLALLLPGYEVVDLTRKSETIHDIRIIGLNSATFKNGYGKLSGRNKQAQEDELLRVEKEAVQPGPKIIFTHIPNLEDPFEPAPGERRNAWNLDAAPAKMWDGIVNRPDVLGVFAGHFHDSRRNIYEQDYSWAKTKPNPIEGKKTWVAPPLAVKFQNQRKPQARGLLLATVSANGAISEMPEWFGYADPTPTADKASVLLQADVEALYESWNQALTYYGQALASTDPAVRAQAQQRYFDARKHVQDGQWIERLKWIWGVVLIVAATVCLLLITRSLLILIKIRAP
jgi:hypothetical protein